jgi:glycosyltransferase involved in cell wall biosynthesis
LARIGINTRFLIQGKMEGFGWYTYEICKRIASDHPEHEFFFFFDRPYHPDFKFTSNVTPVVLRPAARHPFLFILWFELLVTRALAKYKIDLFFSPDGYLSLRTNVPQVCTIHDINFEHFPQDIPAAPRWYLRRYFPKFAVKAKHIITVSDFSKRDIAKTYSVPNEKITAIWNGASEIFQPLNSPEVAIIRQKLTGGKPYFIFVGSIHPRKNLNRLLEAYEAYVKGSDDPWHLVIVGAPMWKEKGLSHLSGTLASQFIHFTGRLDQQTLAETMGAAGALTFVPYFEGFGIPLVEAMKCGIPILAGDRSCLPEIAGDAAIYCDPFEVKSIHEGLLTISTNDQLREELSKKAMERSLLFDWNISAKKTWEVITAQLA